MGIYRNDYKKEEDETLWELHEIRHKIHKKIENTAIDEFNRDALKKLEQWRKNCKKEEIFA
ncbi:MAG: hypothetical protein AB1498_13000 [bacterium]